MKFTKGRKVEVFSKREVSTGSWRPAEIITGDGHTYTVKYHKISDNPVIGWVSQKAIRPRPPLQASNWISGDIVEVFDNFSWKLGKVLKKIGQNQILVELHGSLVNLILDSDEIRVRLSWEEGKWVIPRKSLNYEDGWTGFTRKLKNSSPFSSTEWEYSVGASRKYRHVEKESQTYRVMEKTPAEHANQMPSQCDMNCKKRGRSSLIIRFPVTMHMGESKQPVDSFSSVRSDSDDEDSDLCSIGSCSTTDSWSELIPCGPAADIDGDLSDAESSCAPNHDEPYSFLDSLEKEAAERIHQLELQGYRCTLRALHASGPLSWEQQSLISNLRISLNISNDEHLMELKSLLSSRFL